MTLEGNGVNKMASFRRAVSVRVEEKKDEPDVPVPCPTPTLQELEAVFDKEMASGSSPLSVTKMASFRRAVSVRVEEKKDEPDVPVPCPTPTLQELEAVFDKGMASGSSTLSVTKMASFRRAVSVRVEEKKDEPDVPVPCPTPTLQELEAVFDKEMASGSSTLSVTKMASFRRAVSVRVEEKKDEPDVPVPCPTPTLQELEAVFDKEMASGSSTLSVTKMASFRRAVSVRVEEKKDEPDVPVPCPTPTLQELEAVFDKEMASGSSTLSVTKMASFRRAVSVRVEEKKDEPDVPVPCPTPTLQELEAVFDKEMASGSSTLSVTKMASFRRAVSVRVEEKKDEPDVPVPCPTPTLQELEAVFDKEMASSSLWGLAVASGVLATIGVVVMVVFQMRRKA